MDNIVIQGNAVSCDNPAVRLDFGGFAKGYGIQKIIAYLQSQGVQHAMVNAGGDLMVMGHRQSRPWRVALQNPLAIPIGNEIVTRREVVSNRSVQIVHEDCEQPKQRCHDFISDGYIGEPLAYIDVYDKEAVFSSGTYFRQFSDGKKTYHHILDPRTGYPADGFIATTILHTDATLADAAATSLLIAEEEEWESIAEQMGITHALLIDQDGKVYITPAMQEHITWVKEPYQLIIVDLPAKA